MIALIGPCMFVAPLLVVLVPVAVVLWPVVLAATGMAWLVLWPLARGARAVGVAWPTRWAAGAGRLFVTLLRPWNYFDPPKTEGAPD
jgi:hypothetical protein